MRGNYLIPANTKRGKLILGLFYPVDLVILLSGIGVSLILLAILPIDKIAIAILAIAPGLICAGLVLPVAYYHNVRKLLVEMYKYFNSRKRYIWKGWCFLNDEPSESNNTTK